MDRDDRQALLAALGLLEPEELEAFARALDASATLRQEAADWQEVTTLLASSLPPCSPPPSLRVALLAETAEGAERFAPLLARLAQLLDLGREAARAQLDRLFDAAQWVAFPLEGITLLHLQGGPATAGADVGFVRVEAGHLFPPHTHLGVEEVLVMQGRFLDSDGTVYRAGDVARGLAGSRHHFEALAGEALIYAVVVFGVSFEGGESIPHD